MQLISRPDTASPRPVPPLLPAEAMPTMERISPSIQTTQPRTGTNDTNRPISANTKPAVATPFGCRTIMG